MEKIVMWGLVTICSGLGSWIPSLWHAGMLSVAGIVGGLIGAVLGFWLNAKLSDYVNL
jgi:hypothetical protein